MTPVRYHRGANVPLTSIGPDVTHEPVDLVAEDGPVSSGVLYEPTAVRKTRRKVGVHLMHPRTDQSRNYAIAPLARAGFTVLGRAGRWVNNDVGTVHERLLYDVAAGVRLLRDRGCDHVVLLGNSGGGSLACFYQSQAESAPAERLTDTAAGSAIDLAAANLPPAEAVALLGAHPGEGACLLKWIDPAVDDASLDMYDPANGFRLPPEPSSYDDDFVAAYRAAQRARVARIDQRARELLAERRAAQRHAAEAVESWERTRHEREAAEAQHLLTERTMADPAFCDLSIDPDDRTVSAYDNHPRPDLVNAGLSVAAVLQPQAWLSTWSGLSSRASTVDNLAGITAPVLVVHYAGDVITRMDEARSMQRAAAGESELAVVRHADHYGFTIAADGSRGDRTTDGTDAVLSWLDERFR